MPTHTLAHRFASRHSAAPVVVVAPRRGEGVRRRAGRAVRATARFARKHGKEHLSPMGIAMGGLLVGALDARGYLNRIPTIGGSRAVTLGIAGYLAVRYGGKHQIIRNAGMAALGAAAFDYGKVHGAPGGAEGKSPARAPAPAAAPPAAAHGEEF